MAGPSRILDDHLEMAVPSPVGDVKIVSSISTFVLNTLTHNKGAFFCVSPVARMPLCVRLGTQQQARVTSALVCADLWRSMMQCMHVPYMYCITTATQDNAHQQPLIALLYSRYD